MFHIKVDGMVVHIYNLNLPNTLNNDLAENRVNATVKSVAIVPLRLLSVTSYGYRFSLTSPVQPDHGTSNRKLASKVYLEQKRSNTEMLDIRKQSLRTVAKPELTHNPYCVPPLCYGNYVAWKSFLSGGGYFSVTHKGTLTEKVNPISLSKQEMASQFVDAILTPDARSTERRGWKNRQLGFHNSMRLLRHSFVAAPRDEWENCLPTKTGMSLLYSC